MDVVHMVDRRDACRVLVRKPDGKVLHGKLRRRWKGNIRMDFKSVYRTWTGLIWRRIGTGGGLCDHSNETSFIHSIGMCRIRRFLAVLRSFVHSSLLCTFSCHPYPPTILPSSLTPSCHLFLGLPLNLVPKLIYNTLLGILFSSTLYTYPNQRSLFNLIVSVIVGFLTLAQISLLVSNETAGSKNIWWISWVVEKPLVPQKGLPHGVS